MFALLCNILWSKLYLFLRVFEVKKQTQKTLKSAENNAVTPLGKWVMNLDAVRQQSEL